eukprot:5170556-Pleurochrysis_carterae.AAC.7
MVDAREHSLTHVFLTADANASIGKSSYCEGLDAALKLQHGQLNKAERPEGYPGAGCVGEL